MLLVGRRSGHLCLLDAQARIHMSSVTSGFEGCMKAATKTLWLSHVQARIHMSSVNSGMKAARPAKGGPRPAPLLIFDELTRGESYLYVRQCTAVNAGALLLVAAGLDHSRVLRQAVTRMVPQSEESCSETSSEEDVASMDWADSDSISSELSSSSAAADDDDEDDGGRTSPPCGWE